MRVTYTKGEREFLEAMVIKNTTNIPSAKGDADPGPESKLLSKCVKYLKDRHFKHFHDYSRGINKAGFLDLYIFLPMGRLVVIELKGKTGRLSTEQKEWINYLLFHRYNVYPDVKSFKRFVEIIENNL